MTFTFIRNSQFSFPSSSSSLNTFACMDSQASSYIHTYIHTCISQGRERPDCATFAQTEKKATWIEQQYCGKVWFSLWLVTWHLTAKLTCCSSRERKRAAWGGGLCAGRARRRGPGSRLPGSVRQSSVGWATHSPLPNKSLQWIKRIGVVMATSTISLSFSNLHQLLGKTLNTP
jgi:hypothetical protein